MAVLTNYNVCLGSGLFDYGRVVQRAIDKLDLGIFGFNLLALFLIADQKRVVIVRMLLLKRIESVTTDVA